MAASRLAGRPIYRRQLQSQDQAARSHHGPRETLIVTGPSGRADGPLAEAELFEPEGVGVRGTPQSLLLFIADTNNHLIRVADLVASILRTLAVRGLERLQSRAAQARKGVRLPPSVVLPGHVTFTLDITLPPGYKLNPAAPVTVREARDGLGLVHAFDAFTLPTFIVQVDEAHGLNLDLTLYYCQAEDERLCRS